MNIHSVKSLGAIGLIAVTLPAALLSGCGPKEYVPTPVDEPKKIDAAAATPKTVIPLTPGKSWTYRIETVAAGAASAPADKDLMVMQVTGVQDTPKGQLATLEFRRGDKVSDRQQWLVTDKGILQTSAGLSETPYQPGQPLFLFPITPGKEVAWKGTGITPIGKPGKMDYTVISRAPEPVDTGMGKRTGIPVDSVGTFTAGNLKGGYSVTTWFEPNVGIVRLKQGILLSNGSITTTMVLTRQS
ncbi:MAG: hypothetical protein SFX74_10225 [Fimbriimonadaceae bacterium]|nr:hypothetical protein [Fimbriimonadaceae bacterium]